MKLTVPGILIITLIVASPVALAENSDYWNTVSPPSASFAKDDQTNVTKRSKKNTASFKHQTHANAKAQTTGSGNNMAKPEKDDTTPKSK
jgi:hypothetical protein